MVSAADRSKAAETGVARNPTADQIWRHVAKASFAVVSHVTPSGEPRSSGVVYATIGRRMFVVVAQDGWKARHIAANGHVAVTVPVRRGGIMSLVLPIPPATVSFHASAILYTARSPQGQAVLTKMARLIPAGRRTTGRIVEIIPEGWFVTYGIGVSLLQMRDPGVARARVPVA
jgi:hypothetical protein